MVLLDEHRRHVEVNGAYLRLLGYQRTVLIGRPAYEFVSDGPLITAREWRAVLRRKQFTGVADLVHADGGLVRVEFGGHPEVVTGQRLVLFVALRTARASRRFLDREPPSDRISLSARELEIVRLIAAGLSGPEIATEVQLTHNTVRTHARNSMAKLGARSRAQLVAKSLGEGLLWDEMSGSAHARSPLVR
jgi:DNA-binding CsgD family transcriptional regulator